MFRDSVEKGERREWGEDVFSWRWELYRASSWMGWEREDLRLDGVHEVNIALGTPLGDEEFLSRGMNYKFSIGKSLIREPEIEKHPCPPPPLVVQEHRLKRTAKPSYIRILIQKIRQKHFY